LQEYLILISALTLTGIHEIKCNHQGWLLTNNFSLWKCHFTDLTFCSSVRQEVIDITLRSYGLLDSITDWEGSSEPSLSDDRHFLFTL